MDTDFFKDWFGALDSGLNKMNTQECSRQSMTCVFKDLVPDKAFTIECVESILSGSNICCHRIVFEG